MPDISMCKNSKCPSCESCYRYTALPDHWQSYMSFDNKSKDKCDYYWENEYTTNDGE